MSAVALRCNSHHKPTVGHVFIQWARIRESCRPVVPWVRMLRMCRPSRPFRHTCTKDGHFCVQGSSQTTLELDLTDVNFLIWLLSVMQACTQQLLCCDIFIFLCFFFPFFLGLSVFYCIILRRNCVGSYRLSLDPWQWSVAVVGYGLSHSITYHLQKLISCFAPAHIDYVCLLPQNPLHPAPNVMYTYIALLHSLSASLCFHNSSVLYPVDLCRSPFLFLVVNTFPSMLNNVCLCVQVSLCILSWCHAVTSFFFFF